MALRFGALPVLACLAALPLPLVAGELNAQIRVHHLSPDAPNVDVFANGRDVVVTDLAYPNATGYLSVPGGVYTFDVAPAGLGVKSSVLNIPDVTLNAGTSYTAVAYNTVDRITALLLEDDRTTPDRGTFRIRPVHTAAGVGQVDLWNVTDFFNPAPLVTDLDFGAAAEPLVVPQGQYDLALDVDNDAQGDFYFSLPAIDSEAIISAYATLDSGGVSLQAAFDDGTNATIRGDAPSFLRVLHLSPDAPNVDVLVDGASAPIVSNLPFPTGTAYANFKPGTYNFSVAATGSTEPVLSLPGTELAAGTHYTVVAFDEVASLQPLALVDDRTAPAAGNIRLRVAHTAAGIGQVDVLVLGGAAPLPLISNLDFGAASAVAEVPSLAYTIGLDTNNDLTPEVTFNVPALPAGTIANVFAVADATGPFLLAQLQDSTTVRIDPVPPPAKTNIRVLHLSPDAPNVDVFVNGALRAVENLPFPTGTDYLNIDAGTYDFDVVATGAPVSSSVLNINDLELAADTFYTAVAFDNLATIKALPLVDDRTAPAAGNIRLRVAHTAAGIGQVDVLVLNDPAAPAQLIADLDFGVAANAVEVPAQAYTVGLDVNNDATPELVFNVPALPAGTIANVFAVADADGAFLLAQLDGATTVRIDPSATPILEFAFDDGATNAWQNGSASEFIAPDFSFTTGSLAITTSDNTNSFGFWESPLIAINGATAPTIAGGTGENGLYRATFLLNSDVADRTRTPTVRFRTSSEDWSRSDVSVITSTDAGTYPPTAEGKLFTHHFQLPLGTERFRTTFDVLNFADDNNVADATVALGPVLIEALSTALLTSGTQVVDLTFEPGTNNGFTPTTIPTLFGTPSFDITQDGLEIVANVDTVDRSYFGFWGRETDIPFAPDTLYEVRWTVLTGEAPGSESLVPAYRLRINDSTFQSSAYVNIESTQPTPAVRGKQTATTYSLWYSTPAEIAGNNWLFAFDYLLTPESGNAGNIPVTLRNLEVIAYPQSSD